MIEMDLCRIIVERYYCDIYNFCNYNLNDSSAAEDCAQETFLELFRKRDKLYFTENILTWLTLTAKNVIKRYRNANQYEHEDISDYADKIQDTSDFNHNPMSIIYDNLSPAEVEMLIKYIYCKNTKEKEALAEVNNISPGALYVKISRIKKKLRNNINNKQ